MKMKILWLVAITLFLISSNGYAEIYVPYEDMIGKQVRLRSYADFGIVYLGDNMHDFNEMVNDLMTRDKDDYMSLYLATEVVELRTNTLGIILDVDLFRNAAKVEVTSGTYAGATGWILLNQAVGY